MGDIKEVLGPTKNKRTIQKFSRQAGLAYHDSKGKLQPGKLFKFKKCNCVFQCGSKLNYKAREDIFHRFWALANWNAQTAFLKASVREVSC